MSREVAGALAVSLGLFAVYAAGACPTVYVGDSGELTTAVHVLGIPHPSGYPLYVLVGKLWTLLVPLGSIAYRMSLMSAACAAVAGGVVYWACRRLGLRLEAALLSCLMLAFGPSFWSQANIQRVYALNALFVALAMASAFSWWRHRSDRVLTAGFFVCGLGATNHTFMAIVGVALAIFTFASGLRRARSFVAGGAAFLAGLLPYVYLPLRSRNDPRLDWGNPESLPAVVDVVLRRDFWDRAWLAAPSDLVAIVADYLSGVGAELLWLGAILAVAGVWSGLRRGWPVLFPLLVMAGNLAAVALHGSRSDIFIWHRYYIPSYLMAAVLAGMGVHVLVAGLPRRLHLVPLLLPAWGLALGYARNDRSDYRLAEDFARALLETVPPGAHLVASDDNVLFVLLYLHHVEGMRADVDLIPQGVGGEALPPLRFDPDTEPVFLTHHPNWNVEGLEIVPVGLAFRAVRSGGQLPPLATLPVELAGESDPRVPKDYLTRNLIGHFHYMLGVTFESRDWVRAMREFRKARRAASENDVLFYNLGLIYARNGLFPESLAAFERAHEINNREIPSSRPVRAWDRVLELQERVRSQAALDERIGSELQAAPGTPEYHRRMAERLRAEGYGVAARGHLLRAEALEGGEAKASGERGRP